MKRHHTRETWLTPPHILAALGAFDLDPCAAPPAAGWKTARRMISLPDDGLAVRWSGRVWLNPPYGDQVARWLDRLADHGDGIALVFARTDTVAFHDQVFRKADAALFLRGRVRFCDESGVARTQTPAPSVLVAYGRANGDVLRTCGLAGTFIPLDPKLAPYEARLFA